ncbi:Tannase/feruloyl esterase [Aspergillus undulatus]|uniref:Tannase/feruloyl esterase n=1 Tax=Aspergillus undulatus TaxID=1810928 RepID=UPI003CCD4801
MKPRAAFTLGALCGVQAGPINRENHDTRCTDLLNLYQNTSAIQVHLATGIQTRGLNISSEDGTKATQNEIPLCHVQGTIKYAEGPDGHAQAGSNGKASLTWEVFLPEYSGYNGRYLGIGNGGYAGIIDNYTMLTHLNSGYAVGGCDGGHHVNENKNGDGGSHAPFMEDTAKVQAWIHDSIALTTSVARDAIAETYYSSSPEYSYYYGCSTGGGQGYALAEFYPELFDGILAEGPGNYYTHLILSFLWNQQHTKGDGFMDQDDLDFITDSVLDACDEHDGVGDRVIENPTKCQFDIETLACGSGQHSANQSLCLTPSQIEAAKAIYEGAKDTTGNQVYPGFNPGTEASWLEHETTLFESYGAPILRRLVFNDTSYDALKDFNWNRDLAAVNALASPLIDSISNNLSAFHARNGKFITAQGWADQINAASWPVQHLTDIRDTMGSETVDEFMRLFMIPGGGHCGANEAYPHVPATYRILDALVNWVEEGILPDEGVLSEKPPDGRDVTRRLCPWPKQARFVGGDHGYWGNYECVIV